MVLTYKDSEEKTKFSLLFILILQLHAGRTTGNLDADRKSLQDSSPDLEEEDTYNRIFMLSILSSSQIEIVLLEVRVVCAQENTKTSHKCQL